jgi:predicted transcriptional regulator
MSISTSELSDAGSKRRFTIELSARLDDALDKIAKENATTKAEALRFAIQLLDASVDAKKDGFKVGGWKEGSEGVLIKERLFLGL